MVFDKVFYDIWKKRKYKFNHKLSNKFIMYYGKWKLLTLLRHKEYFIEMFTDKWMLQAALRAFTKQFGLYSIANEKSESLFSMPENHFVSYRN